jgi:hypothetical protein
MKYEADDRFESSGRSGVRDFFLGAVSPNSGREVLNTTSNVRSGKTCVGLPVRLRIQPRSTEMRRLELACIVLLAISGCEALKAPPQPLSKGATFDMFVVSPTSVPGCKQMTDPATKTELYLVVPSIVVTADVETVQRFEDPYAGAAIEFNLTADGAKKLAAATAAPAPGMRMATVVNGAIANVATVTFPLTGGFAISGVNGEQREKLFAELTKK